MKTKGTTYNTGIFYVIAEGLRFVVQLNGPQDTPVVMLSNSLSCDMSMWDEQVGLWGDRFRILRYDQRGHGNSGAPNSPWSIDQLGFDAVAILDALDIRRVHWCGVSLGSMTGMWMAINAPDRINRLVLANTAAHMGPPSLWDNRVAMALQGGMTAVSGPTIERWFPTHFRHAAPETMRRMLEMVERTPVAGYVGCCLAIRDMDLREQLNVIKSDTLVIIGSRDPATLPEQGMFIADRIANAQVQVLDVGHISNVEKPDQFAALVAGFFESDV